MKPYYDVVADRFVVWEPHETGERMKPATIKDRILEALEAGPSTSRELAGKLKVSLGTVPACMSQLRDAGKVQEHAIARYGRSKARAIVWRLTNASMVSVAEAQD